eukprot:TRINITY_DN16548_c0_g1_i2.p1 TRINITY_DN16548_c0_g1~~TRINITY_DN16548_c0_g1_i2.p1  ORF type:complete len:1094 (-),score=248.78 TRINITY_DN16548_c0_g1_i2:108-3389(-)
MAVFTTPRNLRSGYGVASKESDAAGEHWTRFEQRRHRMNPPNLFDEAVKRFEKYGQLAENQSEGQQQPKFPGLSTPDTSTIAAAAATTAAAPEQKQLDVDLGLRKARFFDRCLRADRELASPRSRHRSSSARESLDSRPYVKSPEDGKLQELLPKSASPVGGEQQSPRMSPRATMSGTETLNFTMTTSFTESDGQVPAPAEEEQQQTQTFEESVGSLVQQCRRVRLHPATTGIVRPDGGDKLKLEYGFLTDERAEAMNDILKAASAEVREVLCRSNGLTERGATSLLQALPFTVKSIDLSQNDLSHGHGWCAALKNFNKLYSLTLSDCQLVDSVAKEVLNCLRHCKLLAKLDLSGNSISEVGKDIRSLLKGRSALEVFDIHWNLISGNSAKSLVKGLYDNAENGGKLHDVNLSFNPLGKIGAKETCQQLAKLFVETSTLRHLDISKCDLSAACCQILADGLKDNSSLLGVHVSGNEARLDPQGFIVPSPQAAPQEPAAALTEAKAELAKQTKMEMERDKCCWVCERWRETRLCYVPGVSGPDVSDVWVFTAIDGFETPIKMQRVGEEFVTYVMAAPGPLRYFFQAGTEVLCSRTAPQVDIEELLLTVRAGVGLYPGTTITAEKSSSSDTYVLRRKRARAPGEQTEEETIPDPIPVKGGKGSAEAKAETEEVPKISFEVEIDMFSTTMVVARPPDEPVCRAFVPRHVGELKGNFPPEEWNIERSLFAPRHEALSIRAFCERCFEADWRISEAGHFCKDETDRAATRDLLREHYAEMKVLYSSLCSVDWGLLQMHPDERPRTLSFGVGMNEYTHMLVQHNLVGEEMSLEEADALFIAAAIPPQDTSTWFEANCMEGHMVQRHGFFGLLVRIAACFARNADAAKSKGKSDKVSKVLQGLLNKHIMYPFPPMKNNFRCVQWRVDILHTEVVEAVFCKHMKAVVDPLFTAYSHRQDAMGSRPHLRPEDWFRLLDALEVFPWQEGAENAVMNTWDRVWLWQVSAMTQIDEVNTSRSLELVFVEFLEALARLVGLTKSRQLAARANSDIESCDYGLGVPSAPTVFCLEDGVSDKEVFAEYLDGFLSSPSLLQVISQASNP